MIQPPPHRLEQWQQLVNAHGVLKTPDDDRVEAVSRCWRRMQGIEEKEWHTGCMCMQLRGIVRDSAVSSGEKGAQCIWPQA